MRSPTALLVALLAIAFAATADANTPLVTSQFDSGAEGWSNVTLPYPSAVPPTITFTFAPLWSSGRLTLTDPDGTNPSGDAQYWRAPAKFLGNQSSAGVLRCDLADTDAGYGPFTQEDVVLVGGGLTLSYSLGAAPPTSATLATFTLDFYGGGARLGGSGSPLATREQVGTALSALTDLFIRAEYRLGPDTQYLDNVSLETPNVGVDPAAAPRMLSLSRPAPNPSNGAAHVAFTLPMGGDVDLGVFDVNGRRVATLASGELPAGEHAATWDGTDASGHRVKAGIYWLELTHGGTRTTQRIVRLK